MKPRLALPFTSFAAALSLALAVATGSGAAAGPVPSTERYVFHNVTLGGGGFVTGIIFSPAEKGLVYVRTDVGGAYRRDSSGGPWTPLLDWVNQTDWNLFGVESLACDPSEAGRVYVAAGTYNNPGASNGEVLRSGDHARIARWRRAQSLRRTIARRPDLMERRGGVSAADQAILDEFPPLDGMSENG